MVSGHGGGAERNRLINNRLAHPTLIFVEVARQQCFDRLDSFCFRQFRIQVPQMGIRLQAVGFGGLDQ